MAAAAAAVAAAVAAAAVAVAGGPQGLCSTPAGGGEWAARALAARVAAAVEVR